MVSKATYGDQIWNMMGSELIRWNKAAAAIIVESMFNFWLVNIFHFCEYTEGIVKAMSHALLNSALRPPLGPWDTLQVSNLPAQLNAGLIFVSQTDYEDR
jgi:hypothetical protein